MARMGMTFDGTQLAGLFASPVRFIVEDVEGRNALALDAALSRSDGSDGSRFIEASLPPRDIVVTYSLIGDGTLASQRSADETLLGALLSDGPRRLAFDDQGGRYYEGIYTGAAVSQGGKAWYSGSAVFTCPRPFLYGDKITRTISGGTHAASTNYFVEPVWTVRASGDASGGFTLTVNGEVFTYDGPLGSGASVVVNSETRETRVGGVLRVAEVSGTYPVLRASNTVALSIPGTISVEYRARWV